MSERGEREAVGDASDDRIASALESIVRNPSTAFASLNGVVHHLQFKLGLDLTHKVDFIRSHLRLLLRSHPSPPPNARNDHLAPRRPPDFHPRFGLALRPGAEPTCESRIAAAEGAAANAPIESAQTGKKRRGGPGGLYKLCGVTPELQTIVGQPTLPRTEIVKQLWAYIRKHNLQDPSNRRKIICNDELRLVFETDCTDMFNMNKLLAKHVIYLEPTKPEGQSSKKPKIEGGAGTDITESDPIVIISEPLANLFGTSGREMPQSEALRRVWQYAKVNQLVDPMNPMAILCDTKLQELLGCPSLSVPLAHLFKRE